jgi:hypothetical protein
LISVVTLPQLKLVAILARSSRWPRTLFVSQPAHFNGLTRLLVTMVFLLLVILASATVPANNVIISALSDAEHTHGPSSRWNADMLLDFLVNAGTITFSCCLSNHQMIII